jgi:soluble cytochrome b562
MTSDDYVELARELLSKMSEFIHASEPGEPLNALNTAYTVVKRTVEAAKPDSELAKKKRALRTLEETVAEEKEKAAADRAKWEAERKKMREEREGWTRLDRNVKVGRILTALGSDALILREIVERIQEEHPGISVYENDLRGPLAEMLARGEVERQKEPRGPNHEMKGRSGWRWRWHRSAPEMTPELQDLEQRLKDADA